MVGGKGVDEDGETVTESDQLVQSTCRKKQEERQSEGRNNNRSKKGVRRDRRRDKCKRSAGEKIKSRGRDMENYDGL